MNVTIDRATFDRLRAANPVPRPDDLLNPDPVNDPAVARVSPSQVHHSDRNQLTIGRNAKAPRAYRLRTWPRLLVAAGALAGMVVVLVTTRTTPVMAPLDVADAFFATISHGDDEAFLEIYAEDASVFGQIGATTGEILDEYFAFRRAIGSDYDADCVVGTVREGGSTDVSCRYVWGNGIARGFGVPGVPGVVIMQVQNGHITALVSDGFDRGWEPSEMLDVRLHLDWGVPIEYLRQVVPAEFEAACQPLGTQLAVGADCGALAMAHLKGMIDEFAETCDGDICHRPTMEELDRVMRTWQYQAPED